MLQNCTPSSTLTHSAELWATFFVCLKQSVLCRDFFYVRFSRG